MNQRKLKIAAACAVAIAAIAIAFAVNLHGSRGDAVADFLNIPSLPTSATVLGCESPPGVITDVITKCTLSISPEDFPKLLRGYAYEKKGRDYEVWPKQFKAGGFVRVEPNDLKDHAVVNAYIE